jgi:CelD/BcsL family acetyltransferase involved in cellulose biosynthesis
MIVTATTLVTPSRDSRDLSTQVITDAAAFLELERHWNELLAASVAKNPFLTSEWLDAWWAHLRGNALRYAIAVRSGSQLIAIAPLVMRPGRLALAPRLEFLGAGKGGADYLDLIVRAGHEDEAVAEIARTVDALQMPMWLDHLPPAALAEGLRPHLESAGWSAIDSSPDVCPVVELKGHTFESYLGTLGASHRANYRRRLRALTADFELRFAPVTTEPDRKVALNALREFHARRWQSEGQSATFADPALERFQEDFTRTALDAGWLRLYILWLNDVPAAVMYGFVGGDRFYFYQHGFHEDYAKYGVGLVLMGLTIQAALEGGAAEFDMLYGHEPYKYLWARTERRLGRLQLFPPSSSGRLLRRHAETRQALRSFVHHIGLTNRDDHV